MHICDIQAEFIEYTLNRKKDKMWSFMETEIKTKANNT